MITRSGADYDVVLHDDSACGGAAVRLQGSGTLSENTLTVNYSFACPGKTPIPVTFDYRYDSEDDTLTESQSNVVWNRTV